MKQEIYILSNGKLFCDSGTIAFVDSSLKKTVYPIKNISDIYCLGLVSLTSGIIKRVLSNNLNIHFLSRYGTYIGSLSYSTLNDGLLIKKQVQSSTDIQKRMMIAREFLESLKQSIKYLLIRYEKKKYPLRELIIKINEVNFENAQTPNELMGFESGLWKILYESLRIIIKNFNFENRNYNPPVGEINAMISFGNMLLYSETYSIIRRVGLLPEIGFLHESNEKRYTLAIDISEMFKPMIVFSTIIYLTNKQLITKEDFDNQSGYTYLNDDGKFTFIREFNNRLNKLFYHKELNRKISIRSLIKIECEKLKTALIEEKPYYSFKRWYECL